MKNSTNKCALKLLATLAVVVGATGLTIDGFAKPVQAAEFKYFYSGDAVEASGILTTTDSTDANGYLTIIGITGQRNGSTITGLLPPGSFPNDVPPFGVPNDNLFSPKQPYLSFNGVSYLVGSQPENFFYYPEVGGYAETDDPNGAPVNYRLLNKFDVQPVPEPSNAASLSVVLLSGAWLLKKKLTPSSSQHQG
ncbi:PEP-CTERM sorting domain-containing protein [Nostoc sp.]|uniref:PEP-CTERM sorting domain-containing protein n=1 Tax=Nostoc sp. TaxID=1180 RepID=UPI002FF76016